MKGMPLPFDFEGKGVLDLELIVKNQGFFSSGCGDLYQRNCCFEPNSVLDSVTTPSQITSSSTLSSSLGGGGGGAASTENPSSKWQQQDSSTTATSTNAARPNSGLLPIPTSLEIGAAAVGGTGENPQRFAMEAWETVLSESASVSPSQEQSILRWFMGDVEDPALGNLNKVLQIGGGATVMPPAELDFSGGYGSEEQGFAGNHHLGVSFVPTLPVLPTNDNRSSAEKLGFLPNSAPANLKLSPNPYPSTVFNNTGSHHQTPFDSSGEVKPQIFTSGLLMNNQHSQNASFFFPLSYAQQQQQSSTFLPPPAKRQSSGGLCDGGLHPAGQISKGPSIDTGQQELLMGKLPLSLQQQVPHHLQFPPYYLPQRPISEEWRPNLVAGDHSLQQQQQGTIDLLYKAAELLHTGNLALAHGILARLNHQLSPVGKPFHRAAFYCKEALQLLLHCTSNNLNIPYSTALPPFNLFSKIGAYKLFSEISPLIQFANFTSNQAIIEALEGSDRIHIIDFDIGYGGQWASLMQELAMRSGGAPSMKITALVSPMNHDQLELGLTRENLTQFAREINISVEIQVMSIDSLSSGSWLIASQSPENEAIAVNLPATSVANYQFSLPMVLRYVKQLCPRIVVTTDRGCDRTDLSFANIVIHALQSYSSLMESLEASANVPMDAIQKIERFLLQPGIEKLILSRFRSSEKMQHWRSMFLSAGFSPVTFSTLTDAQAECIIKRTSVGGFQIEKKQSSFVLCWQRKELISASAWRC